MYFYIDCLQKKGKFGLIWIAAFECADFHKNSTKMTIKSWDVEQSCDDILRYTIEGRENSPKMNLYVTATLLSGLAKVFREKAVLTLRDAANIFMRWGEIARSRCIKDVKPKKFKQCNDPYELATSLGYLVLHKHNYSVPNVELQNIELIKESKGKQKRKSSQEKREETSIIEPEALMEMLREADVDLTHEHIVDPQTITMEEVLPPQEVPADQTFGGTGLESLLPEVQDALQDKGPEIEPASIHEVSLHPEILETIEIPPPSAEKDTSDIPLEVEREVPTIEVEHQLPTIEVEQHKDVVVEVDIDTVIQEMLETEEELLRDDEEPRVEKELHRRSRDAITEFSMEKLKERCTNFFNLMRHTDPREDSSRIPQKQKSQMAPDWLISEELRSAAHLLPRTAWPPARPQHVVTLPLFGEKPQQEFEGEFREVQEIRDGEYLEDSSMQLRPSLGSPTPKTIPREARVRATPSPSPLGKEGKRSYAEINILTTLEPISEAIIPDPEELLQMEEMEHLLEVPIQPIEKSQHTLSEEDKSSPAKRQRLEEKSSSTEPPPSLPISYEDKLLLLLSEHLASNETATFRDLAPPSNTSRRVAAHLFSSLLGLEKKQVLKTQQDEAYGDIYIYTIEPID